MLGVLACAPARAAEPRWPEGRYKYIAVNQSLHDALVEFGRNIGVTMRISDKVKAQLGPTMPTGTAREFLNDLCSRYGLVWHFDGLVMNIATEAEIQTEILPLTPYAAAGAQERLSRLGVLEPRFAITVSQKDDAISISGPPSYIDLVRRTLGPAIASDQPGSKAVQVRVFRGQQSEVQTMPAGAKH